MSTPHQPGPDGDNSDVGHASEHGSNGNPSSHTNHPGLSNTVSAAASAASRPAPGDAVGHLPSPEARRPHGAPAFVMLGLLGLTLPFLVLLFSFAPAFVLAFILHTAETAPKGGAAALMLALPLGTAITGLTVLAALVAFLLHLTHWPRPLLTTALLLVALVPVVLQAPALAMWFDGERGAALGIEIGPTELGIGPPGMTGPAGYLHLAAVILTLLAVELQRRSRARDTPTARGTAAATKRPHASRAGLLWASAALALTVPLSTWVTLEYLRADTARRIQEYTDSISEYPYPLAVLDAPGWRTWHLKADYEYGRSFTVVYVNEDDVQLEVMTRPDYDLWHDCPDGREDIGPESSDSDPVCEEGRAEVSGLNNQASDYETFAAPTVAFDASEESVTTSAYSGTTEARVDLRSSGSPHYAQSLDASGNASAPWADDADAGPAAVLVPADNPRESFLQAEVPFRIPAADLREAAGHVRLLNPADSEAVRELATSAYLAK